MAKFHNDKSVRYKVIIEKKMSSNSLKRLAVKDLCVVLNDVFTAPAR